MRTFDNTNQLDRIAIFKRLATSDPLIIVTTRAVEITDPETGLPSGNFAYYADIESDLLDTAIETALSTAQTQAETDAIANFLAARVNGLSIPQLGDHTATQVESYIETQTNPGGLTKQQALDAVDAVRTGSLANFATDLKPIIKNMIRSQYEMIALLKLIGDAIVPLRDFVWP